MRVRRAFAYCLDRQTIAEVVNPGAGFVLNSYIPDYHPYYPSDATEYPFDPAQGRDLLDAAGWSDTDGDGIRDKDGTKFSVTHITTDATSRYIVTSLVAAQMKNNCGIEVIPDQRPASEVYGDWPDGPIFGRKFDLAEFAWLTGVGPPCDLYLTSNIPSDANPGGENDPGYSNPVYDAACNQALSSINESDKRSYHQQAVRIFTQELPVLPLFLRVKYGFASPEITGLKFDPTESELWNLEELRVGESTSIPQAGGNLDSPEDATSYEFTPDTFPEMATVNHVALSPIDIPSFKPLLGAGHFFEVFAVDGDGKSIEPVKPYTLTIQYTDGELGMAIENTTALYYWDENQFQWVKEPTGILKPAENMIIANPDHFSIWALLAETKLNYLPFTVR